ncbi:MAG: response regulator [Bacteroidetes bacterium]|nr:MAG: response regulator [Bacteroidota bacterium]
MATLKIMIVEDEIIVAKDIQRILKKLGYEAFDPFANGKKALDSIEKLNPDLILLDINLKSSELDGIQVAEQIHQHYQIPFIFLTAFSDKATLERAKLTEPYGYIIKPFEEDDIRTAIEIAYYKYTKDLEMQNKGNRFAAALDSLEVAVIITGSNDKVIFMNKMAETLTGCLKQEALGKDIGIAMKNSPGETKNVFKTLAHSVVGENPSLESGPQVPVSNGATEHSVAVNTFPILTVNNKINGCAFVLTSPGRKDSVQETSADKNLFNFLENIYANNSFFVKKDSRFVKVNFQDILWIEALDNYVIIKTSSKEQFILHSSMKDIEAKLPQLNFARAHRSYIVQLDKISALEENACIIDGNRIPIGKSYKDNLMSRLNMF